MNILLAQNAVYVPTWGGANKENRVMLERLAEHGHTCSVVAPATGALAAASLDVFRSDLAARGITARCEADACVFEQDGVGVTAVTNPSRLLARLVSAIETSRPDLVLVASEDPGQLLLDAALRASRVPVVYVGRTTLALPFGPGSLGENRRGVECLRRTSGIIVVSRFLQSYFRMWAGLEAVVLPVSIHGPGPFPCLGRYDQGFVTMINPCAYKGLPIFLEMAAARPELPFAAVPTWGTTDEDRRRLDATSNLTVLTPTDDIDEILSRTRVLVVPSLWAENRARIITEAMLRGVPVLASDVGGNAEALLGVDYLLAVTPITAFHNRLDDRMLPVPVVPDQNVTPWVDALDALTSSADNYSRVSSAARAAALAENESVTIDPVEAYLNGLLHQTAAN